MDEEGSVDCLTTRKSGLMDLLYIDSTVTGIWMMKL